MLIFIGLGLWDIKDISLRGLEVAKRAEKVYVEFYTSLFFSSVDEISKILGKEVEVLKRSDLEENCRVILEEAKNKDVAILVPGDPMVATTHTALRVEAKKIGVESKIIHSSSIISAICGITGLQSYKFGKSATVSWTKSRAPVDVIFANRSINAHTLLLLDLHPAMKISDAIEKLQEVDENLSKMYAVGVARVGYDNLVLCNKMEELKKYDFGSPPHCLVVLSPKLHVVECEYLRIFANAPDEIERFV
ncbi:MAG: diphthine synthase [Archaeoglobaceae archaeon]|nr:diphthine synthase [Archaeoglobaceae archaeon]MCX8152601.1 diphthine synthase [Archaeoglobaceae archaeon]MDW8014117.1 diphthine synthase [Archaeoglobaceae archaeon]